MISGTAYADDKVFDPNLGQFIRNRCEAQKEKRSRDPNMEGSSALFQSLKIDHADSIKQQMGLAE